MASEHVVAACGEASSQGPETTARISALLYLLILTLLTCFLGSVLVTAVAAGLLVQAVLS